MRIRCTELRNILGMHEHTPRTSLIEAWCGPALGRFRQLLQLHCSAASADCKRDSSVSVLLAPVLQDHSGPSIAERTAATGALLAICCNLVKGMHSAVDKAQAARVMRILRTAKTHPFPNHYMQTFSLTNHNCLSASATEELQT